MILNGKHSVNFQLLWMIARDHNMQIPAAPLNKSELSLPLTRSSELESPVFTVLLFNAVPAELLLPLLRKSWESDFFQAFPVNGKRE